MSLVKKIHTHVRRILNALSRHRFFQRMILYGENIECPIGIAHSITWNFFQQFHDTLTATLKFSTISL
jgi:hypothetical protein